MKKIISLTKVFVKEYYQNLPIFDNEKKKLNKKSVFFWLLAIIFFGVAYVSYEIIKFLVEIQQAPIFLNLFFVALFGILTFQTILACANIFYFSKDIENVLYMPIKPTELLISKLNTMLFILYATEGLIAIIPLILYGMQTSANLLYYFWSILILTTFPLLIAVVVGILTLLIMRLAKFIKNKEIYQIITAILLIVVILAVEFAITTNIASASENSQIKEQILTLNEKIQGINKYFLIVNPSVNILTKPQGIQAIVNFAQIIIINMISLIIFTSIGKAIYLKDLLKNMVSISKKRKNKKDIDIKQKIRTKSKAKSYISKEIKLLIREPAFFMQCIFPVISLLISAVIIVIGLYPAFMQAMEDEELKNAINNITLNTEIICDILIILQVLYSISNISLTAISREGKNAFTIKYIPIELYKQFIYKNIPQIVLNMLITIVVLILIWYILPTINALYILAIFIIATLISIINSYLMLIVDLRRPNLDWKTEDSVVKRNDNKLFQYALMIVNILILLYIATIFKATNLQVALTAEVAIYLIILIIIDRTVKKWQNKLFNKIN